MEPLILKTDSVLLEFDNRKILQDVYLECKQGEVVGILGRNGCGKSSLLRIIFGTLTPAYKHVSISGEYIKKGYKNMRVAYLPQHNYLPKDIKIKNLAKNIIDDRFYNDLEAHPIYRDYHNKTIAELSGGELRQLEILLVIYSKADFILLDEPFTHISPIQAEALKVIIKRCAQIKGVILTDHQYYNILDVSDRIILITNGYTRPIKHKDDLVLLSGSFNNWSTLKGIMLKTDSGWVADARLVPGIYEYKYIIDGRWQRDRDNLQQHADGFNDVNSVYYKYNHTFTLKGYPNAKKVMLAGSFNNWDSGNIALQKTGNRWQTRFYLHDGTHTYRFWVDDQWITDPTNPITVKDAEGHTNSVLNLGETVTFKLNGHTEAKKVYLAGSFNNWKPGEILLKKTATGWAIPIIVPPGNYGYKFIVDDNWITDPANPRHITEGGISNSFISIKPNYTFKLEGYANAKSVHIAGNFNDWDPDGLVMDHTGNEWTIKMHLKQGKYRYKFLADGKWLIDPANKLYEQNEQHTNNSFIWIE